MKKPIVTALIVTVLISFLAAAAQAIPVPTIVNGKYVSTDVTEIPGGGKLYAIHCTPKCPKCGQFSNQNRTFVYNPKSPDNKYEYTILCENCLLNDRTSEFKLKMFIK